MSILLLHLKPNNSFLHVVVTFDISCKKKKKILKSFELFVSLFVLRLNNSI